MQADFESIVTASFILSYFGEWNRSRDCGNCSRCNPQKYPRGAKLEQIEQRPPAIRPVPAESSTIVALKILSCVLRVHQKLGREKIAKILAGSEDISVESYRSLSTYGLLSDYSLKAVVGLIDHPDTRITSLRKKACARPSM